MTDKPATRLDTRASLGAKPAWVSASLLFLVSLILFVVPTLPQQTQGSSYNLLFTLLVITAALSMDRGRKKIFRLAAILVVVVWIANFAGLEVLLTVSRTLLFLFFVLIVFGLITQIARRKQVTTRVIVESISGYLLLGVVFSLIVGVVTSLQPEAFNFTLSGAEGGELASFRSDFAYYALVTYTTLGYGEIVPVTPLAKSLAMLMAITGPIYLTVIIAMLVGKFLSYSQEMTDK